MTNHEAYQIDLDDLLKEIDRLLSAVPVGRTKMQLQAREQAEAAAGRARATIGCMRNDYIIVECLKPPAPEVTRAERCNYETDRHALQGVREHYCLDLGGPIRL